MYFGVVLWSCFELSIQAMESYRVKLFTPPPPSLSIFLQAVIHTLPATAPTLCMTKTYLLIIWLSDFLTFTVDLKSRKRQRHNWCCWTSLPWSVSESKADVLDMSLLEYWKEQQNIPGMSLGADLNATHVMHVTEKVWKWRLCYCNVTLAKSKWEVTHWIRGRTYCGKVARTSLETLRTSVDTLPSVFVNVFSVSAGNHRRCCFWSSECFHCSVCVAADCAHAQFSVRVSMTG